MTVTAKLRIILKAEDVVVAESEDPRLWQKVLSAINSQQTETVSPRDDQSLGFDEDSKDDDSISQFAKRIGIPVDQLVGACDPSVSPPFIHLDEHHWEDLKKNTPSRGPNSISATSLALTLLVLWKDVSGLDRPTLREAAAVRDTIGIDDKNPARSLRNCEWLQERGGSVRLNPSQTSKAYAIVRAYCSRTSVNID